MTSVAANRGTTPEMMAMPAAIKAAACKISPKNRQITTRHKRSSRLEIKEMCEADRYQANAEKHPVRHQTSIADKEIQILSVPIVGKRYEYDTTPRVTIAVEHADHQWSTPMTQPSTAVLRAVARSKARRKISRAARAGRSTPQQARADSNAYKCANIHQRLSRRHRLRNRLPARSKSL